MDPAVLDEVFPAVFNELYHTQYASSEGWELMPDAVDMLEVDAAYDRARSFMAQHWGVSAPRL